MPREMTVSDSVVVAAPADELYAQISDPTQMARWSPENTGASVPEPGAPARVGMTFVGSNKRGPVRWVTKCVVTAADPGQRFAFDVRVYGVGVPVLPIRIASWEYRFEPVEDGTRVIETWTDGRRRWPDAATRMFDPIATRKPSFAEFQRGNIKRTLRNLKADFES
ncbi:SRPBCC family protein [Nocardioides humilatus]|uniref:SRPBCC family protein n=1 Tax=Nocardioides humilatus TaxID=2607660 RepID=A0A5B1L946_9ACTN|nr:SRPBCC family protein [Nocardioides humilatus]KAA1416824.1 SRPBCC family protein [Nocardioides humilatus]